MYSDTANSCAMCKITCTFVHKCVDVYRFMKKVINTIKMSISDCLGIIAFMCVLRTKCVWPVEVISLGCRV